MGESGLAGLCTGPFCVFHQAVLGYLYPHPPTHYTPLLHPLSSIPTRATESSPHPFQASAKSSAEAGGPHILATEGVWSLDSTRTHLLI